MNYNFELTDQPAKPVLSIRTRTAVGNLPQELGKAYHAIIQHLGEIGEKPLDAAFAAYYNMDMENLDVEMGFPVSKPLAGKGNIKSSEIPAGKQVSYIHKGPYQEMGPAYDAISQWITDNGYTATGMCYEFYYNSPMEVAESELLTKIVFPLK